MVGVYVNIVKRGWGSVGGGQGKWEGEEWRGGGEGEVMRLVSVVGVLLGEEILDVKAVQNHCDVGEWFGEMSPM